MDNFQCKRIVEQLERIAEALEKANEINEEIMRNH
jgi:hypothetical protein